MSAPVNLAFAGCGFLGLYHTGVVAALRCHGKELLKKVNRVSGASAGSLHAAMLVCDTPLEKCIDTGIQISSKIRSNIHAIPWQNLDTDLRNKLDELLGEDAHQVASSRLFVSLTSFQSPVNVSNKLKSQFDTKNDLIDTLALSCYIPFYSGFHFPKQGDEWVIDGGYSDNLPKYEGFANISVSPFAGSPAEISPEQEVAESARNIFLMNMPFALTTSNIKRLSSVVVPPSTADLKVLYESGYRDCKLFLKKRGMFETGEYPDVLHLFEQQHHAQQDHQDGA